MRQISREIARSIVRIRNCRERPGIWHGKNRTKPFEREEEESLVMAVLQVGNDYRAAKGAAEVVLPARRPPSGIRLMRIQRLVSNAIEKAAVILVRPGLRGEVVNAALGLAEFGRIVSGLEAHFLQRFDRWLLTEKERRRVELVLS